MINNKIEWIVSLKVLMTLYIIIHHLHLYVYNIWLYLPFGQGQFVVILFWILSGYTTSLHYSKGITINFLKNRIFKLLPIFTISLVITYLFECIFTGRFTNVNSVIFIGNVLQLQDLERHPGVYVSVYKYNTPLWFMSYLTWYYIVFFVFRKYLLEPNIKLASIIGVFSILLYLIFPNPINHFVWYFPIWYSGYLLQSKVKVISILILLVIQLTTGLICLCYNNFDFQQYPFLEVRHFSYAIVGVGFIHFLQSAKTFLNRPSKLFVFLNKISYPLFLIHYPILISYNPFHFNYYLLNIGSGLALSILLAHIIAEVNERVIQNKLNFN